MYSVPVFSPGLLTAVLHSFDFSHSCNFLEAGPQRCNSSRADGGRRVSWPPFDSFLVAAPSPLVLRVMTCLGFRSSFPNHDQDLAPDTKDCYSR